MANALCRMRLLFAPADSDDIRRTDIIDIAVYRNPAALQSNDDLKFVVLSTATGNALPPRPEYSRQRHAMANRTKRPLELPSLDQD